MTTAQQAIAYYSIQDIQIMIHHYLFLSNQLDICNKQGFHYYCIIVQKYKTLESRKCSAEYETAKHLEKKYKDEAVKLYAAVSHYEKQFKTAFFRYAFIEYKHKLNIEHSILMPFATKFIA